MTTNEDYVISNILEEQKVLQARFQQLGYLFFKIWKCLGFKGVDMRFL